MQKYWRQLKQEKELMTIIFGSLAFSFILITTLNFTLAFLTFVIFVNLAIFQKSFHLGWIFSLLIIVMFPTVYISDNLISLEEVFTLLLAIIGLGNLLLDKNKIKLFPLFYYWLGVIVWGGVLILFGNFGYIGKEINQITLYQLVMVFLIYPMIITSFQYFFQTKKRLEKFFLFIVAIGTGQALFGLLIRFLNLELNNGIGITNETFANISQGGIRQLTGFFGDKLFLSLGDNILAILLLITIPITLGMLLIQKYDLSTIIKSDKKGKNVSYFKNVLDSVFSSRNGELNKVVDLKTPLKLKINRQRLFLVLLVIQISALILTFSYVALIILGVSLLIMGILLREQKIIWITLILLSVFILILPGFEPALIAKQKIYLLAIWSKIKNQREFIWLWRGLKGNWRQPIYNSYLVVLSKFGIIGLGLFLLGLAQYFREIRLAYLKSDGFERIWLVVILTIFVEFILLGLFNNALLVGPVALLFWLLYGALQNLKYNQIEFGLTETKINSNKLNS